MSDFSNLENLFTLMKPLRTSGCGEAEVKDSPLFQISIINGEPFLQPIKAKQDTSAMSVSDARIQNEITRLKNSNDIFDINIGDKAQAGVSLWDNPYLIHLIENRPSIEGPKGGQLKFTENRACLILRLTTNETSAETDVQLCLKSDNQELTDIILLDDTHVLCEDSVYNVDSTGPNYTLITKLVTPVDKTLIEPYLTFLLSYADNILPVLNGVPARKSAHSERAVPTLFLEKVASDKALYLRTGISLESLDTTLPSGFEPARTVYISDGGFINIRNVESCDIEEATASLENMILSCAPDRNTRKEVFRDGNFFIVPELVAGPFLLRCLPGLLEQFRLVGSEKLKEYKVIASTPKLNFNFTSGLNFIEGEGDVTIEEEHFTIADILSQFNSRRYITLSDGNRCIVDEKYIARLRRLFRNCDENGHIKVTFFDLPEVENIIQTKIKGEFANRTRAVLEGFNKLKKSKNTAYSVKATLRPYQSEGVKWLRYLYDNRLGGCLADDMGLGKTLQTIALLTSIYPGASQPTLIVMPRSLLFNWEKELNRFAPQLSHSTYYGPERNLDESLKADIILTTYAVVRNDIEKLREHTFECIVLDESQNIKNYNALTTLAILMLESQHRFALSGTPMENNLTELYSLFRFLNPAMFGSLEDFNSAYTYPIQKTGDKEATDSLRRRIFPFILRRLKKDVLEDLPERIDQTIYIEMTEKQAQLYNERRIGYRRQIEEAIARDGIQKSQFIMFQALNELRRIASVPESVSDGKVSSPKIDELVESLVSSVSNGHKAVVFFNFLAGLDIVMARLEKMEIGFETMTGSTPAVARKRSVERFQTDPSCMVMLLTLKVGGVGLNLTAADTVYIFEPWWNKAAEEQAVNRLHRIGQKSTVNTLSIITVGTIEEKIVQLQEQKSELFNELISADTASSKHLSEKDIDFILS